MNVLVDILGSVAEEAKYILSPEDDTIEEPEATPQDLETALFEKIRALELENALLEEKLAKAGDGHFHIAETVEEARNVPPERQTTLRQMIISQEILGKPLALR
ncbi:MAG: hypothetical protein LBM98_10770 [Oscillospiraceae bacterium]|jgi:hypothetical protein|nr:hypothetical protein [Oscillospiraceae bacterium]